MLAGACAAATVVVTVVAGRRLERASIGVGLDASRRWVTLARVHPGFADACRVRRAQHVADR